MHFLHGIKKFPHSKPILTKIKIKLFILLLLPEKIINKQLSGCEHYLPVEKPLEYAILQSLICIQR